MIERVSILFGIADQVLELYPPEFTEGVPAAAATYRVWRGEHSYQEAPTLSGTATMDTVDLQVTGASGYSQANRRRVSMASTAGVVVGRLYVLVNGEGQAEIVKVVRLSANAWIEVEYDLAYDYPAAASSKLKGFYQSFVVDTTFASTEANLNDADFAWRVEWAYTVNGKPRRHVTNFDLVRVAFEHGVLPQDLAESYPDIFYDEARSQRGTKAQKFIAKGVQRLWFDLTTAKVDPNRIAEMQIRDQLVTDAALLCEAESKRPDAENLAWRRERFATYRRDLEAVLAGSKGGDRDPQQGNTNGEAVRRPMFRS